MSRKVLIANRGEIAVRIVRALRTMGYGSVAVYSEIDRGSPHVALADEACLIGGASPLSSYLSIESLLDAASRSGADAIHPGYGFLSESAAFARATEEAGLLFIGPSSRAIEVMGDKLRAREAAEAAGVPLMAGARIDGAEGGDPGDEADLVEKAEAIGLPLLLKAVGGGGGKGMRVVHRMEDLVPSYQAARTEAQAAFDRADVYLERYLPQARHVEVQIAADRAGRVVHLGERECSVQRRHQKVIEESPCPSLSPELRDRLTGASVDLARRIGYTTLGTIEFLVDFEGRSSFLEMNTRLQVEHPVTEWVTGMDLVELQIRLAEGEDLPVTQEEIGFRGHAMEVRICAEDPYANFVPSVGRIESLQFPGGPGVRVDAGVVPGQEVSLYYDPLIAKIITRGRDRDEAIRRMRGALSELRVHGVKTTGPLALAVLGEKRFLEGRWDTAHLDGWAKRRGPLEKPGDGGSGSATEGNVSVPGFEGDEETLASAVACLLRHHWEHEGTGRVQSPAASSGEMESLWLRQARIDGLGRRS